MNKLAHNSTQAELTIELLEDDVELYGKTYHIYWVEVAVKYNHDKIHGPDREVLQTSTKVETKELAYKFYDRMKAGYGI